MGKSDHLVKQFYDHCRLESKGETALLGFTNNDWYPGDLYDLSLTIDDRYWNESAALEWAAQALRKLNLSMVLEDTANQRGI